jgi:hypothetical protein
MRRAVGGGVRSAWRAWPVALVLWLWTLLLAGPALGVFAAWLLPRLAYAPEGDVLLGQFSVGMLVELMRAGDGGARAMIVGAVAGMVVTAAVGRAFLMGGLIEVLRPVGADAATEAPLLARFFGGAGRWFLPNLGLLALTASGGALAVTAAFFAVRLVTAPLAESSSAVLGSVALLGPPVAAAVVVILFSLVYDYACIGRARPRGFWAAWLGAIAFVARRLPGALGLWLAAGGLVALAAAAYLAFRSVVPADTWPWIVVMIAAQQAFTLVRAWLRTALVGAEIRYALPDNAAPVPSPLHLQATWRAELVEERVE